MSKCLSKNFFKKNGKILKGIEALDTPISSIFDIKEDQISVLFEAKEETMVQKFFSNGRKWAADFIKDVDFSSKSAYAGALVAMVLFFFVAVKTATVDDKLLPKHNNKYSIYSSKPLTLEQSTYDVFATDTRAQKINAIFKSYNCPLEGMGEVFVREADKNDIPWWLVAAVSFQESGCGKITPTVDGKESYNAWGWGVYGDTTHSFDNWARGVETVSKYFSTKFYSKGVNDVCEIMKTYTPPSNGSWCEGVKHFGDLIQEYKSPES